MSCWFYKNIFLLWKDVLSNQLQIFIEQCAPFIVTKRFHIWPVALYSRNTCNLFERLEARTHTRRHIEKSLSTQIENLTGLRKYIKIRGNILSWEFTHLSVSFSAALLPSHLLTWFHDPLPPSDMNHHLGWSRGLLADRNEGTGHTVWFSSFLLKLGEKKLGSFL